MAHPLVVTTGGVVLFHFLPNQYFDTYCCNF
jgi:hypothetical protein